MLDVIISLHSISKFNVTSYQRIARHGQWAAMSMPYLEIVCDFEHQQDIAEFYNGSTETFPFAVSCTDKWGALSQTQRDALSLIMMSFVNNAG